MADAQLNNPLDPYSTLLQNYGPQPAANVIPFRRPVQPTPPTVQPQHQPSLPTPPQAPQLAPLPTQAPAQQITDAFQKMSPSLVLFAALGGALSGNAVASTVNSMASFLKGVHEGDSEASEYNLKKFNENFNLAKSRNEQAIAQYNLDLQNYITQADKLTGALMSTAVANGDGVIEGLLKGGHIKEAVDYILAKQKAQEAAQQHADALNLRVDGAWGPIMQYTLANGKTVQGSQNRITRAYEDLQGNPIDPKQVTKAETPAQVQTPLTDQSLDYAADALHAGNQSFVQMFLGFSRNRVDTLNQVLARVKEKYPDTTGAQLAAFAAQYGGVKAAATTAGHIGGTVAVGAQELDRMVPLVEAASKKIDRTRFPTVNSIELAVKKGTGDTDVIQLNSYIQTIRNAYALVMSRGGRVTDQQRKYAEDIIKGNLSVDQLTAALNAIKNEAAVAGQSAAAASKEVTGQIPPPSAPAQTPAAPAPTKSFNYTTDGKLVESP